MGRSRRILRMERNCYYRNFYIARAVFKAEEPGAGPYVLQYKDREILRRQRHGECRDELEKLVMEKWNVDRKIRQLQSDFCKKWNLGEWPQRA